MVEAFSHAGGFQSSYFSYTDIIGMSITLFLTENEHNIPNEKTYNTTMELMNLKQH
jgi:hypothetical protein